MGDIDGPPWQEARTDFWEPHHKPAETDDYDAPKNGKVVKLLPVGPSIELWLRSSAKKPLLVCPKVADILPVGHRRVRTEEHSDELSRGAFSGSRVSEHSPVFPQGDA